MFEFVYYPNTSKAKTFVSTKFYDSHKFEAFSKVHNLINLKFDMNRLMTILHANYPELFHSRKIVYSFLYSFFRLGGILRPTIHFFNFNEYFLKI